MTVRIVRLAHPCPTDHAHDGPYEEVLVYDRAYRVGNRQSVIAVGPVEIQAKTPRQFTLEHIVEMDFEQLDLITYEEMLEDLPGDIQAFPDDAVTVERFS